jgi:hypothetical protein
MINTPHALLITPEDVVVAINLPGAPDHPAFLRAVLCADECTAIRLTDEIVIWVCDDPLRHRVNGLATLVARHFAAERRRYAGHALLTGPTGTAGNPLPLDRPHLYNMVALLDQLTT